MMANDFFHDEVEELLREVRIEFGILRQPAQAGDLGRFREGSAAGKLWAALNSPTAWVHLKRSARR
jgi:hypothetical protein